MSTLGKFIVANAVYDYVHGKKKKVRDLTCEHCGHTNFTFTRPGVLVCAKCNTRKEY
jgi:ribosomal protein L37AE/L43A